MPFPVNPVLQWQENEPGILLQLAWGWHTSGVCIHSSISEEFWGVKLYICTRKTNIPDWRKRTEQCIATPHGHSNLLSTCRNSDILIQWHVQKMVNTLIHIIILSQWTLLIVNLTSLAYLARNKCLLNDIYLYNYPCHFLYTLHYTYTGTIHCKTYNFRCCDRYEDSLRIRLPLQIIKCVYFGEMS